MTGRAESGFAVVAVLLLAGASPSISQEEHMPPERTLFVHPLDTLDSLEIHAATARIVEENEGKALELEGILLIPELELQDAGVEVEILAPAPCYPGIVFRYADLRTYELAYVVPAASGQSDAIQYDPVFNGSNTWQLHNGPAYQRQATVPTGEWFTLRIDVVGERAAIRIANQPPLVVERLSHGQTAGGVGLWTFRPARFRNLCVTPARSFDNLSGEIPQAPEGVIDAWWLPGTGSITTEANGVLNLNRYKPSSYGEVQLVRYFSLDDRLDLEIAFGYSDELQLSLDGTMLFEGTNTFAGFESYEARGWVRPEYGRLVHPTGAGRHRLEAVLRPTEPFGWGLIVALGGGEARLLPPDAFPSDETRQSSRQ